MDRSLVLAESPAPRSSALCSANTNLNLEMAHLKLSPQAVRIIKMEKFETGRPQTPPRPSASRRENPRRCSASSGTARASTSTPAIWQARYSSLTGMCCSIANSRCSETMRSTGGSRPRHGMSNPHTNFRRYRGHRKSTCAMRISAATQTPTTGSSNPTIRSLPREEAAALAAGFSARSLANTSLIGTGVANGFGRAALYLQPRASGLPAARKLDCIFAQRGGKEIAGMPTDNSIFEGCVRFRPDLRSR